MSWELVGRDTVDSTNEVAKVLLSEGAGAWTVVSARKQVEGRGRFGRSWASPRGGLYASVIVQEELPRLPLVSLAAGVAAVEALGEQGAESVLRWPNDVYIGERKVGGILVEGLIQPRGYWAIVGVGINSDFSVEAFPASVRHEATTLRHELGRKIDNRALLNEYMEALLQNYPSTGKEGQVVARYKELCTTLGKDLEVEISEGILEGKAVDITSSGFLLLETLDNRRIEVAEGSIRRYV